VIFFHSFCGYTKRQLSSPRVTISTLPRSFRHLDGTDSRFLGSSVCLYSPININLIAKVDLDTGTDRWSYHGRYPDQLLCILFSSIPLSPTTTTLYTTLSHCKPKQSTKQWISGLCQSSVSTPDTCILSRPSTKKSTRCVDFLVSIYFLTSSVLKDQLLFNKVIGNRKCKFLFRLYFSCHFFIDSRR
jgi:hypothetical protein